MEYLPPFDCQDKIEVGFVEMNHSKSVYFENAGVFKDHDVHDCFPMFEDVAVA